MDNRTVTAGSGDDNVINPTVSADANRKIGEMVELYSTLSVSEQRSLLKSITGLASIVTQDGPSVGISADCLTSREKQVLVLLTHGYSRREIGSSLKISLNTASRHISNIYRKVDVSTVAEAVRWAMAARLI